MMIYDYPKADTLRAKRKIQRKMRQSVRHMNRALKEDIFKDRFWIEIIGQEIRPYPDNSGWDAYFRIAFHDNEHHERDFSRWYTPYFIMYSGFFAGGEHMDTDLNKFIVDSDFWSEHYNKMTH